MNASLADLQNPSYWSSQKLIEEARFKASLSGGKGGQHVNKTSSKAELYWLPASSTIVPDEAKKKLLTKLSSKLNSEGELRLVCDEERSLLKNKEKLTLKFYKLVASCFKTPKPRKATKPSASSVKKRLDSKAKRKDIKQGRKKID